MQEYRFEFNTSGGNDQWIRGFKNNQFVRRIEGYPCPCLSVSGKDECRWLDPGIGKREKEHAMLPLLLALHFA